MKITDATPHASIRASVAVPQFRRLLAHNSAVALCILTLCGSCRRPARTVSTPAPTHTHPLTFQSHSRYCSEATAVGDTIDAHLLSGGESLTPPRDSGSPARFVLRKFGTAQLRDTASRPLFELELVSLGDTPTPVELHGEPVAVEYRIRSDSTTGRWYVCVHPFSLIKIFVGDGQIKQ